MIKELVVILLVSVLGALGLNKLYPELPLWVYAVWGFVLPKIWFAIKER